MRLASELFLIVALLFIFGCTPQKSREELLEETTLLIQSKKFKTAEILLKEFLVENPDADDLRLVLGNVLNYQGLYQEAEYQYVRVSGKFNDEAFENRIESLYNTSSPDSLISFYKSNRNDLSEGVRISDIAYALTLSRKDKTKSAIKDLSKQITDESSLSNDFALATTTFAKHDDPQKYLEDLRKIADTYGSSRANWLFLETNANLNVAAGNFDAAIDLFSTLLTLRPEHSKTKLSIANAYVLSENWEEADKALDELLAQYPDQPIVNHLKTLSALQKRDLSKAKIHIERALQGGYTSTQNYLIAAEINFNLGNYEQTIEFLERGLQGVKGNSNYHNMLIYARAVTNAEQAVVNDLARDKISSNSQINNIAALLAGLQSSGNTKGIEGIVSAISLEDKVHPAIELEYEVIKLSAGESGNAKDLLDSSTRLMNEYLSGNINFNREQMIVAKSAIIGHLVSKEQFEKAINTIRSWQSVMPSDDTNTLFLSEVYLAAGEYNKSIEALTGYETSAHAYIVKSRAHTQLNNTIVALNTVTEGLEKFPYSLPLLRLYSAYEQELGVNKAGFIKNLYSNSEDRIQEAILLNIYYASHGNLYDAIQTLLSYSGSTENSTIYWYTLAQSYIQNGESELAKAAIDKTKNISIVSFSELKYVLSTYEMLQDNQSLENILRTYIPRFPGNEKLKLRLAEILIQQNKSKDALSVLTTSSESLEYNRIKAKAKMHSGEVAEAGKIYSDNYKAYPSPQTVIDLGQFLVNAGDSRRAQKLIMNFNNTELADANTLLLEGTLMAGEAAIEAYSKTLKLSPNNIVALNNIADELFKLKRYDEALPYAEKASALAPDNAIISKTLSDINAQLAD
ncbi:tetratricopeptide repeat protein [Agaribacter flavus]|uniref:Tetratricopeptide repeat protein n=1 Tax=Agaribacter flavus TaxID=1902781 RepID=A0ABV7FS42_9ALTE